MKFEPTWTSLKQYKCPDWFRDAKFGIWAHWGPQGVPMQGDWYARQMYMPGHRHYEHHVQHYGHPSEFGYKDILTLWTCENFNPSELMRRYKKAGARYFTALAVHHDNFDCWDSRHQKWNSVNVGPRKDMVGLWCQAAREQGLYFGVTEHLERSYSWFNTNKGSDTDGPMAGVPYDGQDPDYQDLYFPPHDDTNYQYPFNPPDWWTKQWADRITDLVDRYDPDLLYTDGGIPFGEVGRSVVSHFYNQNMARRTGRLEAVYNLKSYAETHLKDTTPGQRLGKDGKPIGGHGDFVDGVGILDLERGGTKEIRDQPWQTDTCVGDWYYQEGVEYKSPKLIIHMLVDIVSKNGNMLLNFPGRIDGTLDDRELAILDALADWFAINGEAIYGTRPWTRYGQGQDFPTGDFAEPKESPLGEHEFRFVTKGPNTLYAIAMGWPESGEWCIDVLGDQRVADVELLGQDAELAWSQTEAGLRVSAPEQKPCDLAYSLRITLAS